MATVTPFHRFVEIVELAFARFIAALRLHAAALAMVSLFCSFAVYAQDVLPAPAAPGAPGGIAWVSALLQYVAVPLIPITGSLIIYVLTKLATYLHAKGDNSKVAGAFAIAVDFIETAFVHIRAGIESDLKDALADGTVDSVERQKLVDKLVSLVKAELPGSIQAILGATLGPSLETWLKGKAGQVVQAAVAEGEAKQLAANPLMVAPTSIAAPAPTSPR